MIHAVFLCDVNWKIKKIRQCKEDLTLHEGEIFTDLILEKDNLPVENEGHYALELTFPAWNRTFAAVIDSFREGSLVMLARIANTQDFVEVNNAYEQHLEWAKTHLLGLFHDEYYLISQMNNQLVDARRRLTRSNRQLEQALDENKKINEQLETARIFAEQASASKTRFLANMSHDIRTPMNAIVGLSELMLHRIEEPEVLKNYIAKLQSSSHYLLDLINDILDLSKIENGSMELGVEPMDVGEQIAQVVTIIRPQITKKNQNLSVESECDEFGCVMGDPVRLRQILMNLFSNAVKYTSEGGNIHFVIREISRNDGLCTYQFVIEDNGIGMTKEFATHIFDAFSRAESSVRGIQGTGLGMAITKKIIDAMGGTIRVESALGKGSRFTVTLPFERTEESLSMETEEMGATAEAGEMQSLHGMRFLCAEDNALNAEILEAILEMEDATCKIYENGALLAEAFQTVQPGEYDAILMDIQMPVMNGYEATKQIRGSENPLGKTIPIIAMTANAFSEDVQKCLDVGMDAHIAKPIEIDQIKRTMAFILQK